MGWVGVAERGVMGQRGSLMAAAPRRGGLASRSMQAEREGRMGRSGAVRLRASTEQLSRPRGAAEKNPAAVLLIIGFETLALGDPTVASAMERGGARRRGMRLPGKGGLGDVGLGT